MEILIALSLAVVLLYWWLVGHWFARVLVFLLFAAVFSIAGVAGGSFFEPVDDWIRKPAAPIDFSDLIPAKPAPSAVFSFEEAMKPAAPAPKLLSEAEVGFKAAPTVKIFMILGGLLGFAVAWPLAGLPTYHLLRQRARMIHNPV